MTYNRFEEVSVDNPLPCEEVEGETYTRFQPIGPTNPFPVMVCDEEEYSRFSPISETNPYPIAMGDGDTYSAFNELSETNRLPVVVVEGQSYSAGEEVSMTNPWPVIDTTAEEEPAYVGPLDLVPGAVVAYSSARALSAAMCGQNGYTLFNGTDTQAFAYNASTGLIDAAAIATFIGGGTGRSSIINDHSGNGYSGLQGTDDNRPVWNATYVSSKPGFSFVPEGGVPKKHWVASDVDLAAGDRTYVYVINYTASEDQFQDLTAYQETDEGDTEPHAWIYYNTPNDLAFLVRDFEGNDLAIWLTSGTLSTGNHLLEYQVATNGTVTILVDGVSAAAALDSGVLTALTANLGVQLLLPSFPSGDFLLKLAEFYIWPQQDMGAGARANIMDFYSIS